MARLNSSKLFYFIFIFDLTLNLIPTWKSSFVTRYMPIETWQNFVITVSNTFNTLFFLFLLILTPSRTKGRFTQIVFLMSAWVFLSVLLNMKLQYVISSLGLFAIHFGLFCIDDYKLKPRILYFFSYAVLLWSVTSVLYLPYASGEQLYHLFASEDEYRAVSFCGWGTHRNHYGFYAGLAFLLLFVNKTNKIVLLISLSILSTGLFMSGCRTVILALFISVMYLKWDHISIKQKIWILTVAIIAGIVLWIVANNTESRIATQGNDDRYELYFLFLNIILSNPVLGTGESTMAFSGRYSEGSPCHNFLFQTAADYGIIGLLLFLVFLYLLYRKSTHNARAILVYLIIFGLAQPYFTLRIPLQFTLVAYLFIVYYNNLACPYKKNYIEK